jgi:hypothetical protein
MSLDANQVYQGCWVLALPFEPYHGFLQESFAFKDGCFSSSSAALHGVYPSYPSSSSSSSSSSYAVFVFRVVSAVMLIMHELLENSISHHLCSFFMFSFVLFFCR